MGQVCSSEECCKKKLSRNTIIRDRAQFLAPLTRREREYTHGKSKGSNAKPENVAVYLRSFYP